jgi:hypothetical protein
MIQPSVTEFSAGASMLGYLYQIRIALLWAIRAWRASVPVRKYMLIRAQGIMMAV